MSDQRTTGLVCNASSQVNSKRGLVSKARRRRRGVVIYYMAGAMVTLCGVCSLAVDLGRVQLVKTELRRSADASARAAAAMLPDATQATAAAVQYAASNNADGTPVVLVPAADVEFGTWSGSPVKSFHVVTGSAITTANAVRVTARRTTARGNATPLLFAKVVGATSCDTSASAIAALISKPAMNVVGINGIQINGNDRIDSYDSALGSYGSQAPGSNVNVASNGSVSLTGSSDVHGNVYYGAGSAPTGPITGSTAKLEEPLKYDPPVLPASYTSHGAVSLSGGKTLTLAAGNHYFTSLSMSGSTTLNVTGPVKMYVQGAFSMDGNASIAVAGNSPANLEINILGSSAVTLAKNDLYAMLYAPQSALIMSGNADLFGSVVAATIQMNGNNTIHYDQALPSVTMPPRVVLVK